jgi:hypothetical protein
MGTREGNVPYWVKPNSSGMDSVLVPTLLKCRKLFQVRMRDTGVRSQCMVQLARTSPKALEDIGRLLLDQVRVALLLAFVDISNARLGHAETVDCWVRVDMCLVHDE